MLEKNNNDNIEMIFLIKYCTYLKIIIQN